MGGDSIVGGLEEMAGAAVDYVEDSAEGTLDLVTAGGAAAEHFLGHVDAGILRAVGADETAQRWDRYSDESAADAARYLDEANSEAEQARDDVWGSGETLPRNETEVPWAENE